MQVASGNTVIYTVASPHAAKIGPLVLCNTAAAAITVSADLIPWGHGATARCRRRPRARDPRTLQKFRRKQPNSRGASLYLASSSADAAAWATTAATVLAVAVAVVIALWQLRHQRRLGAIDRTVDFHRDLTAGEIGAARDRLSELMWRVGSSRGENSCWRPSWKELLGGQFAGDADLEQDLSAYPDDMGTSAGQTPLRDLYKILWCFERISASWDGGLLNNPLATQILGNHAVWWDVLCARVPLESTRYRRTLADLAEACNRFDPELLEWARADFRSN